ncbi:MAG: TadE/TadG family type IV pilus assembly protein [Blastocatellia bacterium]
MKERGKNRRRSRSRERGNTLVEFTITGSVFLMTFFGVLDFGRLLWTHNALADAARQGARHAVSNSVTSTAAIRNVVIYRDPDGGYSPVAPGLTANNVEIVYDNIGLGRGTATIRITGYHFRFVTLFFALDFQMPNYQTTLTGETLGFAPPRI